MSGTVEPSGREAAPPGHPFTCVVCGKPGTCDDGSECPGVAPVDDAHCHHNECMEVFGGR